MGLTGSDEGVSVLLTNCLPYNACYLPAMSFNILLQTAL